MNQTQISQLTRIRFTVSYDGTGFFGWQKQNQVGQISICQTLETVLSKVLNEKIHLFASGRTDAGVHALNQVCHFDTKRKFRKTDKPWDLAWALNSHLPPSIVVRKVWLAPPDFHATLSATHKTYKYLLLNRPRPSALLARYAAWERKPIDIGHLQESSKYLLGNQDFKSFQSVGTPVATTTREIFQAQWSYRKPDLLQFQITGSGFLKQMVRNIVGTQILLERKGQDPSDIKKIIELKDRMAAGPPAPAQGLYLQRVYYPADLDIRCLEL